ncbi:MAG: hypothetical protein GY851_28250 [bacterium]|nr:hypothetical protein [bacterium]
MLTVCSIVCAMVAAAPVHPQWGPNGGAMLGTFSRSDELTAQGRAIPPLDDGDAFSVSFRFQTQGHGSYGAVVYAGVRDQASDYDHNGAGVYIFRHNETLGLVGNAFVWDGNGEQVLDKETFVSLAYNTVYDVACAYDPSARTLTARFSETVDGAPVGNPVMLTVPEGVSWNADRLALWNHSDGHRVAGKMDLALDNIQFNDDPPAAFDRDLSELPLGESDAFRWYEGTLPPPIAGIDGPSDVFDEDAVFHASVRPDVTGLVEFSLLTYGNDTVWKETAPIADSTAQVALPAAVTKGLERGEYVLMATVPETPSEPACSAVTLRGRVFRDVTEEPEGIRPGDEIVITDMTLVQPSSAIVDRSEKGKWWLRSYTADGSESQLLCVEDRDKDDPQSCVAPPLTLPLNLRGWYEVWVRTHRPSEGGGIDVKFSDERCFLHADPQQVGAEDGTEMSALVDIRYRADDLTGRGLVFQQPYGTYNSQTMYAGASLAGVRLVKLSDAQVARIRTERQRTPSKTIGYDDDGFSYFHIWGMHHPECIARLLEPMRDTSATFFNIELGGLGGLHIPTPYTGMYQMTGHTRHGDYRANAFYKWSFENDANIADVLAERAHELGLDLYLSLMMERSFSVDATMKAHPEWMVQRGRGRWDYAIPEVQDYQVTKIAWIMENHDIDGFIVDFTRYGYYFNEDEPDKFGHMNAFLRKLRKATDEVNGKKERKVALSASFGDRSWHLTHWGTGILKDQGLDVATWLEEGLFDSIMPEGPTALDFVSQAADSRTQVLPRMVSGVTLVTHDKAPGELGPKAIEREVAAAYEAGAPGIFFFNQEPWTALARVGYEDELRLRARTGAAYGFREGPVAEFTVWYPSLSERDKQREALRPVVADAGPDKTIQGWFEIPVVNTFPELVSATVQLEVPDKDRAAWSIEPAAWHAKIQPGKNDVARVLVKGTTSAEGDGFQFRVEYEANNQIVFRHVVPVRVTQRGSCWQLPSPEAKSHLLEPGPILGRVIGELHPEAGRTSITIVRDPDNLYLVIDRSGLDPGKVDRTATERDSSATLRGEFAQLLVDVEGREEAFLQFVATPAGGQYDASWAYAPFMGHHSRNTKWNGEWTTETVWFDDGYRILMTVPLKTLGAAKAEQGYWRACIRVQGMSGGEAVSYVWPEGCGRDPKEFGMIALD